MHVCMHIYTYMYEYIYVQYVSMFARFFITNNVRFSIDEQSHYLRVLTFSSYYQGSIPDYI